MTRYALAHNLALNVAESDSTTWYIMTHQVGEVLLKRNICRCQLSIPTS